MDQNLNDAAVEEVGQFITKHPINTRDYTFGEIATILFEHRAGSDPGHEQDISKLDNDTIIRLFGKYGKGSKIDSQERHTKS